MARALTAVGLREVRGVRAGAADRVRSRPARRGLGRPRPPAGARERLPRRRARPPRVRQLRRFRDLQELDLPVILLVGGGTGTGKSTVATEVAYRLGITRVTSTDFVRQTMRAFFAKEFMPSIHYSSFEAGLGLRRPRRRSRATPRCSASSTRPATCSSASRPRSSGRSTRAGRWCSRASTSCPG